MRLDIKEGLDITHMNSSEGEKVQLCKPIKTKNQVEAWLLQVQTTMVDTVYKMMKAGLTDFNDGKVERKSWVTKHPG